MGVGCGVGSGRRRGRGAGGAEAVHGGGGTNRDGRADGALSSKVDAASVGKVDAVEHVVIEDAGCRDVGADGRSRNRGRKIVRKGSGDARIGRLAFIVVGRAGRRGTLRRAMGVRQGVRRSVIWLGCVS